jgi:hypothetical protein
MLRQSLQSSHADQVEILQNEEVTSLHVMKMTEEIKPEMRYEFLGLSVKSSPSLMRAFTAVIFAVGVDPHATLAATNDFEIGHTGGVLADDPEAPFSVARKGEGHQGDMSSHVYACGDCCEFVDAYSSLAKGKASTALWRNWTAARETAVACAREVAQRLLPKGSSTFLRITSESESVPPVFSQSLKLFGFHIYCIGNYLAASGETEDGRIVVVTSSQCSDTVPEDRYLRLVLFVSSRSKRAALMGALIVSKSPNDFRLGMNLLKIAKQFRFLDLDDQDSHIDGQSTLSYDWDAHVKRHRKDGPDPEFLDIVKQVMRRR